MLAGAEASIRWDGPILLILREGVVAAAAAGESCRSVAATVKVSVASAVKEPQRLAPNAQEHLYRRPSSANARLIEDGEPRQGVCGLARSAISLMKRIMIRMPMNIRISGQTSRMRGEASAPSKQSLGRQERSAAAGNRGSALDLRVVLVAGFQGADIFIARR